MLSSVRARADATRSSAVFPLGFFLVPRNKRIVMSVRCRRAGWTYSDAILPSAIPLLKLEESRTSLVAQIFWLGFRCKLLRTDGASGRMESLPGRSQRS